MFFHQLFYILQHLFQKKNTFLWSEVGYIICFSVTKSGHVEMQVHDLVVLTINYTFFYHDTWKQSLNLQMSDESICICGLEYTKQRCGTYAIQCIQILQAKYQVPNSVNKKNIFFIFIQIQWSGRALLPRMEHSSLVFLYNLISTQLIHRFMYNKENYKLTLYKIKQG